MPCKTPSDTVTVTVTVTVTAAMAAIAGKKTTQRTQQHRLDPAARNVSPKLNVRAQGAISGVLFEVMPWPDPAWLDR